MRSYTLSPRARADLHGIWKYSVNQWVKNRRIAMPVIHQEIEVVARDPTKGRPCDHLRMGYRMYPAGSHMLFFRLTDSGIHVTRILHQRMDFGGHL
jgi:toxin ParE1/3/4